MQLSVTDRPVGGWFIGRVYTRQHVVVLTSQKSPLIDCNLLPTDFSYPMTWLNIPEKATGKVLVETQPLRRLFRWTWVIID